jgi:predicted amidohydrolase
VSLVIAAAQSASIPGDVPRNAANHLRFATTAAEHGVQLLVFPELSLTGYELALAREKAIRPDAAVLDPLRQLAEKAQMTLVVGAPVWNDNGGLQIGAIAIRPAGPVLTYAKQFLHGDEASVFVPGAGIATLQIGSTGVDEVKVALAICADTSHPEHPANAAGIGANVYAAGVLFYEECYGPDVVNLQGYAAQYRMAVLLANHSGTSGQWVSAGKSAIWSEDGNVVAASTDAAEALVIARKRNGEWDGRVLRVPSAASMLV